MATLKLTAYTTFLCIIQLLANTYFCQAQRIFWTEDNNGRIMVGNLSPTGITGSAPYITGLNSPREISIDPNRNYIFYTEQGGEALVRRAYDGTAPLVLRDYGAMTGFVDIAYSANAGGVFGTLISEEHGATLVFETGGSPVNLSLGSQGNDDFFGIAAHDGNEEVYLVSYDDDAIYVTDIGGSSATQLPIPISGLERLAVDEMNGRLYFSAYSAGNYTIYSSALNGAGLTAVVTSSSQISSIQIYPQFNKVYYVAGNSIYSVNPDGNANTELINLPSAGISDIAIEADIIQPDFASTTPVDNSSSVAPSLTQITITFNEPIKISTDASVAGADVIEIMEEGASFPPTISRSSTAITINNNIATVTLPTPLNQARDYAIRIGAHVFEDLSGNDFPGISSLTVWNFTTTCTLLTAGTATGDQTICSGGDPATILGGTAVDGDGTYTYEWQSSIVSPSTGFNTIPSEVNADYNPPAGLTDTTYYRRIVRSATCTPATGNVIMVAVVDPPAITTHPSSQEVCEFTTVYFDVTATGSALGYQWEVDTGAGFNVITDNSPYFGATTSQLGISDPSGLNGARYRCVVTSSGACPVTSNIAVLTVNSLPVVIDQTPPAVCESNPGLGTAVFDLTTIESALKGGLAELTVAWFQNDDLSVPVATPSAATIENNMELYVTVTHTITGCINQGRATFAVTAAPVAIASPSAPVICSGESTGITLSGATTFSWTVTDNPNVTGESASTGTSINQILNNTSSVQQTVTYTVTPTANGCNGLPLNIPVTVNPIPTAFAVTGGGAYCQGQTGSSVGLSNSQLGITYELLLNSQPTGMTMSPGGGAFNFPPVTNVGTYTVHASSLNCSATMNGSASVQVNNPPSGNGFIGGTPTSLCLRQSGTFTVSGISNATSYVWTVPTGFSSDLTTGNSITVTAQGSSGGILTVTGENQCGTGGSAQLTLNVLPSPTATINLPPDAFAEEEVLFSFASSNPAIQSGQWSFGDGNQASGQEVAHIYRDGGTYPVTVVVTDNNGCQGEATTSLNVKPKAALSDFSIKNVVTANGDEKNAYLYVHDIHKFPDNEVILIDRWGVEVFRAKGYNNDWDLSKDGTFLPAGNYICILKVEGSGQVFKRAVTVINGK